MPDTVVKYSYRPSNLELEVVKDREGKRGVAIKISVLLREIYAIGTPAFFGKKGDGKYALILVKGNDMPYETNETFVSLKNRLVDRYNWPGHTPQCVPTKDGGFALCDLVNDCFFCTAGASGLVNIRSIDDIDPIAHKISFVGNVVPSLSMNDSMWMDIKRYKDNFVILLENREKEKEIEFTKKLLEIGEQSKWIASVWNKNLNEAKENADFASQLGCLNLIILLLVILPMLIVILCRI